MLVVAARQRAELPKGVKDSKKLTTAQRELLFEDLKLSCEFGEGWVSAVEIDRLGLTIATKLAVSRAINALGVLSDEQIVIDGHINYAPKKFKNVETIIKADSLIPIVSAASIYAKVVRDNFMHKIALEHPRYGFENHVGYGTAFHLAAIVSLGSIDNLHRLSFAPLKNVI